MSSRDYPTRWLIIPALVAEIAAMTLYDVLCGCYELSNCITAPGGRSL